LDLLWIKIVFAAGVLLVGLAGALSPWAIGIRSKGRALDLGNTFAGGVLAAAGLVHLLSDAAADFDHVLPNVEYPFASLLAGAGFFLILLIEGVIAPGGHQTAPSRDSSATQHEVGGPPQQSRTAAPILLLVLSIHSLILGLALGAQATLAGILTVFLAVIAHKGVAGFALGISYRRSNFTPRRAAPRLTLFAGMTPLGILLGAIAGAALTTHAAGLFEAIFNALGAGTFIYIATLDIIRTEFSDPHYRGEKWISACGGFAIMAVVAIWI
jgi:zinc transporter 1/2/3